MSDGIHTEHELKLWPEFFQAKLDGLKLWEARSTSDRTFRAGDVVTFREWQPTERGAFTKAGSYTGREYGPVRITYVLDANPVFGGDQCIFSHEPEACCWNDDGTHGAWETECGRTFCFIGEGPEENRYHHCPGCGRPVQVIPSPVRLVQNGVETAHARHYLPPDPPPKYR